MLASNVEARRRGGYTLMKRRPLPLFLLLLLSSAVFAQAQDSTFIAGATLRLGMTRDEVSSLIGASYDGGGSDGSGVGDRGTFSIIKEEWRMKSPFERFLAETLKEFEQHLTNERLEERVRDQRLRGAREYAVFLLGRPHRKGERTKGTI